MAQTNKGIVYPFDYNEMADIPADLKTLAESVDDLLSSYAQTNESANQIQLEYENQLLKAKIKDKNNNVISQSEIELNLDGYVQTDDIVDNLTTDDSTKVLSAKQGKILYEMIGDVESLLEVI